MLLRGLKVEGLELILRIFQHESNLLLDHNDKLRPDCFKAALVNPWEMITLTDCTRKCLHPYVKQKQKRVNIGKF